MPAPAMMAALRLIHFPGIANCVGAKNYKFFILCILYTFIYSFLGVLFGIANYVLWFVGVSPDSDQQGVLAF